MSDTVKVYNLGGRLFHFKDAQGKSASILPKKVTDVPAETAKKLFGMYPAELAEWGGDLPGSMSNEPKVVVREMSLEEMRAKIAEADKGQTTAPPVVEDDKEEGEEEESEEKEDKPKKKKGKK